MSNSTQKKFGKNQQKPGTSSLNIVSFFKGTTSQEPSKKRSIEQITKNENDPKETEKENKKIALSDHTPKSPLPAITPSNTIVETLAQPEEESKASSSKMHLPSSPKFDPAVDAPYRTGEQMPMSFVANVLNEVEECKGQNSKDGIKEIIGNLFRTAMVVNSSELADLFYFFIVKLVPDYEGLETGVGHEQMVKAVATACGKSPQQIREQFKKDGDLGLVVQKGKSAQKNIGSFFKTASKDKPPVTFRHVFDQFKRIAKQSGNNSQKERENIIAKLLQDCSNDEAKYVARWLEKNLKTGCAEKTVISCLARAIAYHSQNKGQGGQKKKMGNAAFFDLEQGIEFGINEAICEFPNYGIVIETLLEVGADMEQLKKRCNIRVGIPVKPMLAKPTKGIHEVLTRFENIRFTCEYKYDGFRGQIHFDRSQVGQEVKIYSRNLENMTNQYPDVVEFVLKQVMEETQSFILDSELVAFDTVQQKILPFQLLTQRSRKNVTQEDLKTRICIFAFDLLYFNGESLLKKPLLERRTQMHNAFTENDESLQFVKYKDAESFEEIEGFLNDSIKDCCEGLMVKTLDLHATYEPSKRSLNWLKLKKDYLDSGIGDSLDLVVVGADFGQGKRVGLYGSFLLACYNEDSECLETVCKIGTGFSDEIFQKLFNQLSEIVVDHPPSTLRFKEKNIDIWFQPKYVWEVKAADLSLSPMYVAAKGAVEMDKGIALRFPRFIREREDKQVEQATNSEQIAQYYRSQAVVNLNAVDDEFDL